MNKLSNYQFFEVVLGGLCLLLWSWGSAKLMGGGWYRTDRECGVGNLDGGGDGWYG